MFDAITGETEEDIMKSAKKLKDMIDDEVETRTKTLNEELVPPTPSGKNKPYQRTGKSPEQTVRENLRTSLGIGKIMH
jgi:hypothetical protein